MVREVPVHFSWNPGLAPSQKKKNVAALHEAATARGISPVLEVSTKSNSALGRRLSAFNLKVTLLNGTSITLEAAFQGSKVFANGGPFTDLYLSDSLEARRDERLRSHGPIQGFLFEGIRFDPEPKTAFYDWLYVQALSPHQDYLHRLMAFAAFSDIEFNPKKSVNCQARSCALFVALLQRGLVSEVAGNPVRFLEVIARTANAQPYSDQTKQARLL